MFVGRCREGAVHGTTVRVDLLGGVVHTLDVQRGVLQRDGGLGADGAAGGQAHGHERMDHKRSPRPGGYR